MKKMFLGLVLVFGLFALAACSDNGASASNGVVNVVHVNDVAGNPGAYFGNIELTGMAVDVNPRGFFLLINDAGDFFVTVVYRGSGALPQVHDIITVTGEFVEDCCNPGYLLHSTSFEVVN